MLIAAFGSFASLAHQTFFYRINAVPPEDQGITQLFITYEIAGIRYKDSLDFSKGQLKLYRELPQPVVAALSTNKPDVEEISVILANNELAVSVTANTIAASVSELQKDYLYLTQNDRIRPGYFPLYSELSAKNDTVGLKKLAIIFDSLKNNDVQKSLQYFRANSTSLLSLFAFSRYTTFFADYSKIETDFAILPEWAKNSPDGKNIFAKIQGAKTVQLNSRATGFIQQSSKGQQISLEAFKGKYVLLDFWASWCGPCRKKHPELIAVYEDFKDKNFEIISISLDSDYDNWVKAIAKDKINWTQLSDLKGQQNEVAIKYGVQAIPANFLVNPEGLIIGKDLKTEELESLLETLLNK